MNNLIPKLVLNTLLAFTFMSIPIHFIDNRVYAIVLAFVFGQIYSVTSKLVNKV